MAADGLRLELNLKDAVQPPWPRGSSKRLGRQRYYSDNVGDAVAAESLRPSLDSATQRAQYAWAVRQQRYSSHFGIDAPTTAAADAPLGYNSHGKPIKKRRKKTRSKQKNLRRDTRPPERRPGGSTGPAGVLINHPLRGSPGSASAGAVLGVHNSSSTQVAHRTLDHDADVDFGDTQAAWDAVAAAAAVPPPRRLAAPAPPNVKGVSRALAAAVQTLHAERPALGAEGAARLLRNDFGRCVRLVRKVLKRLAARDKVTASNGAGSRVKAGARPGRVPCGGGGGGGGGGASSEVAAPPVPAGPAPTPQAARDTTDGYFRAIAAEEPLCYRQFAAAAAAETAGVSRAQGVVASSQKAATAAAATAPGSYSYDWHSDPAFSEGGDDFCSICLPSALPARQQHCAGCGARGHGLGSCPRPPPPMPGPSENYRRLRGGSGGGGCARKGVVADTHNRRRQRRRSARQMATAAGLGTGGVLGGTSTAGRRHKRRRGVAAPAPKDAWLPPPKVSKKAIKRTVWGKKKGRKNGASSGDAVMPAKSAVRGTAHGRGSGGRGTRRRLSAADQQRKLAAKRVARQQRSGKGEGGGNSRKGGKARNAARWKAQRRSNGQGRRA
jgi:hypothetical protein